VETGVWTLRLLALTLAITPVRRLTGWHGLIRYRRMLGLFAFCYATVHLSVYVGLDWFFDLGAIGRDIAKHPYVTVGMAAFVLLIPLAVTSTKGWIRRLGGRRWARVHRLVYVVGVAGVVHYLWAVKRDVRDPVLYGVVIGVLLALRVGFSVVSRVRRGAAGRGAPGVPGRPGLERPSPENI
jgi:sulfoxide reductase heme-binding subunit YedZ